MQLFSRHYFNALKVYNQADAVAFSPKASFAPRKDNKYF